jgi:ECF sigma factor
MIPSSPNVTELLRNWSDGDKQAQEKLFQVVYDELHRQAARYLRNENPGLSLQTTDLIHEAYLRLINQQHVEWQNRLHFFCSRREGYEAHSGGPCERSSGSQTRRH